MDINTFIELHEQEINNREWDKVYTELARYAFYIDIPNFTRSLLSIGVNPVADINRIPDFYLYGDTTISTLSSVCKSAEKIGRRAFAYSTIKEVDFPKNLKTISYSAFTQCYKIEKLNLPEGLEQIGYNAFSACTHVTEIYLPSTLFHVGGDAFTGCTGLKKVIYNGSKEDFSILASNAGNIFSGTNKFEFVFLD